MATRTEPCPSRGARADLGRRRFSLGVVAATLLRGFGFGFGRARARPVDEPEQAPREPWIGHWPRGLSKTPGPGGR